MASAASSILLGTSGLTLAAVAAVALAYSRSAVAGEHIAKVRRIACVAVVVQAGHFAEEYLQQFFIHFPTLLGLEPWSEGFFVSFNVAWLTVWVLAILSLAKFPRLAAFPLWFLAIASVANGVTHPVLSLVVGGYFPGLWSSPLVVILGVVLVSRLVSATRNTDLQHGVV